jgi:Ni,Fe-hydrogenase III large subunit/Ni,Fe-hydrogenase III component G
VSDQPEVTARTALLRQLVGPAGYGVQLESPADNQVLVRVPSAGHLDRLAGHLARSGFRLVTVVANDERELEDRSFKLYYAFSHPGADLFLVAEYALGHDVVDYPSMYRWFNAVDSFEREIIDLFGLRAVVQGRPRVAPGFWLHRGYPPDLFPLRRDRVLAELRATVEAYRPEGGPGPPAAGADQDRGRALLPVGPVHAGIIEPGRFLFRVAGEVVEDLEVRLGYTHRGIERLFQSRMCLLDGWRLAEQVSGDSSFAHSLAYCRAVEVLTETEVPPAAELLRGLFLELERIHSHVGDVAALAEDVALRRPAADLAVLRERLLRLNAQVAGHRYLHRLNRPGGVALPKAFTPAPILRTVEDCLDRFAVLARRVSRRAVFRDRTIGIGRLTPEAATRLGVTGLAARASGAGEDYRRTHPSGVYRAPWLRADPDPLQEPAGDDFTREARSGDVYARFQTRVEEVHTARLLLCRILARWARLPRGDREWLRATPQLLAKNNYSFALGAAEGARGDVVYWLMQDKLGGIYRCKVRDPSMLNWPALREAVLSESLLPDFPLVNKSFNLSYAGNDL